MKRSWPAVALLCTAACGGPNFHFDPKPAPDWTRAETTGQGSTLTAVGSAPTTVENQRDVDLASRDAKSRLAQVFNTQVASRSSDWSISASSGNVEHEHAVAEQDVQTRSNITIDDAPVTKSYRDEATKMQYVEIEVNRHAWLERLHGRVDKEVAALNADIAKLQDALKQKHMLAGYRAYTAGQNRGKAVEPDVIVLDLLDPKAGVGVKLTELKATLADLANHLRSDFGYTLQLNNVPADVTPALRAGLDNFMRGMGFAPASGAGGAKIVVTVSEQFLQVAQVANRQEQVHAALGELKVYEPDGKEVPELAVNLGNRETEQDTDNAKARTKALGLAVDSVVSKFRSAFRKTYTPGT